MRKIFADNRNCQRSFLWIYNSSALWYGSKIWTLLEQCKSRITIAEMKDLIKTTKYMLLTTQALMIYWKHFKHNQFNCYKSIQNFSRFICIIHPVVVSQYKPIYVLLSMLLHQKYKKLKHIFTELIKFVVVDGNMCINFSRMNRSRLTLAVTKFKPAGKRSQGS